MSALIGKLGDLKGELMSLQILRERFAASRATYDFELPTPLSHAEAHRANNDAALRRYAATAIPARVMQLLSSAYMKMFHFLNGYLDAFDAGNPFVMITCARTALEAYAVYHDATRVVRENAGEQEKDFSERVKRVDEVLIKATYGTRHPDIQAFLATERVSKLRDATDADATNTTAKNVLTSIARLSKSDYPEANSDYDLMSEFVHPNFGQNTLLLWPIPTKPHFARMSRDSTDSVPLATRVSLRPMARSARGTREVFQGLKAPFGHQGVVFELPSIN